MRLHFSTDDGQTASVEIRPGDNVWITPDGHDAPVGSLYVTPTGSTIGLGRYSDELAWWEYANPLPLR